MTRVLFACVHNAGRSQIAAALFNLLADPAKARAVSAGTDPASSVHPEVVASMREIGVDLFRATPQRLTDDVARTADFLITMGCGEQCQIVAGVKRDDWPIDDPKGRDTAAVRAIRDRIHARVERLIEREGFGSDSPR